MHAGSRACRLPSHWHPSLPVAKSHDPKTVVAIVATLGLAGVAALSLTPSKKTADVASLYDPTEPHPLYCPWEPNSIVCVLGCGALCQLGPRQCTRVKCCSKETCRNPPPLLLPPTPPTNPDDVTCSAGGCASPVSYFYASLRTAPRSMGASDSPVGSQATRPGSVTCEGGDCIQTGITADGKITCSGSGCDQTGSTAKGGITCPDDPCAKCGEGGMTGRPRAFYSPPGQPPIPVPAARCAKGINGLTDCTDLCQKFPNAPHTTTCCKCYPAC